MRKLLLTGIAAAAMLSAGALAWKAEAATWLEKSGVHAAVQNYTPVQNAACGGVWGRHCRPGFHWVCGPYGRRCWCTPC